MFNPFTSVIGIHEVATSTWILWHTQKALLSGRLNDIFFTTLQGYPQGVSLRFSVPFLNSLLSLPAYIIGGPLFAINFLIVLTFVLTFLGMYLFLSKITQSRWAAIVGSLGFTFSSYRLGRMAVGTSELLSTEWLGFFFYFAYLYFEEKEKKMRGLVGMIICFLLQVYTDYRTFMMLAIVAGLFFIYQGIKSFKDGRIQEYLKTIITFIAGVFAGLLPLFYLHRSIFQLAYRPDPTEYAYINQYRSLELQEYLLPTQNFNMFLGLFLILTVLFYLLFFKKNNSEEKYIYFWGIVGLFFFFLSLGTRIKLNGDILFRSNLLPYNFFIDTPILRLLHDARRFSVIVHFSLIIIFTIAWKNIFEKYKRQKFFALIFLFSCFAAVFQYTAFFSLTTTSLEHTKITKVIQEGKPGSVLTIPFGYFGPFYMNKKDLRLFRKAIFAQLLYQKPLLGMYLDYVDDQTAAWYKKQPILGRLVMCQKYYICEPLTESEKAELINSYHLKYIWIIDKSIDGHVFSFIQRSFPKVKFIIEENQVLYEL